MFRKSSVERRNRDFRAVDLAVVREYQSEIAARREAPYPFAAGLSLQVICSFLVLGVVGMYFARLDRVVSSNSGTLSTADPPLVYQALDPSIIRSLDVKEGQRVGKGQLLATLDPTFAAAQVNQFRAQIEAARIQVARDMALINQTPLNFAPPLNDQIARFQRDSMEFYRQQMETLRAGLASFDQKIATTQTTIEKFRIDEARYEAESAANSQIEDMRVTLEKHGTGSMLNLLEATQAKVETQRLADFSRNSRIEAEHTLASQQADRKNYEQQFNSTISQDLLTARNTLEAALPQLDSALKHQDLVRWTAPDDCIVLSVAPNMSVGSVVSQGTTVISLMLLRNPVEGLVQVSTSQVGFLRPGDRVELDVDAYPHTEFGSLEGSVKWVGDNAMTQLNGQPASTPYYNVAVSIDRNKLVNVPPTATLLPGMTVTANIKVGTHSMWDYVMGGLMRGVGQAMREP